MRLWLGRGRGPSKKDGGMSDRVVSPDFNSLSKFLTGNGLILLKCSLEIGG